MSHRMSGVLWEVLFQKLPATLEKAHPDIAEKVGAELQLFLFQNQAEVTFYR